MIIQFINYRTLYMEHYQLDYLTELQLQNATEVLKNGKIQLSLKIAALQEYQVEINLLSNQIKQKSKRIKELKNQEFLLYRETFQTQNSNIQINKQIEQMQLQNKPFLRELTNLITHYSQMLSKEYQIKQQIVKSAQKQLKYREKQQNLTKKIIELKSKCVNLSEKIVFSQKIQIGAMNMIKKLEQNYIDLCFSVKNMEMQKGKTQKQINQMTIDNFQKQKQIKNTEQKLNLLKQKIQTNKSAILLDQQILATQNTKTQELNDQLKTHLQYLSILKTKHEEKIHFTQQYRSKINKKLLKQQKSNENWMRIKEMIKVKLEYSSRYVKRQQNLRLNNLLKLH